MPQIPPTTLPPADTSAAESLRALADTLSLVDRLRADSTLRHLKSPRDIGEVLSRVTDVLFDPAVWIGMLGVLLKVLLILALAWFVLGLVSRLTHRWQARFADLPAVHPRRQRAFTLGNLLVSSTRYVVWPVVLIMVLSEFDVDVGALIATAGVAGLAIGFGAQTLVKDVISGFFLLFDDSIHVGDVVHIGTDTGVVEHIGVRLIRVRKYDGELLMIPAGELRTFGNKSIGFLRAIVEVQIPYEQNVDEIIGIMRRVAEEWATTKQDQLLEPKPVIQAITEFRESSVVARIAVQVHPSIQYDSELELRMLLKREFDKVGLEPPFRKRVVYVRQDTGDIIPSGSQDES